MKDDHSQSFYVNCPLKEFSEKQKWLFAFVHSIPPDILGLMKILILAQNPQVNSKTMSIKNNQF